MNIKRLLSAGAAAALCLSLAPVSASAAAFPDIENHWAREYILDMTEAGLFTGFDDGTFKPDRKLTAAEALTLCARVATQTYGLDKADIAQMQAVWEDDLEELLGSGYSWFYDEASIALEAGILTWEDLSQRARAGAVAAPLQKELFSVYLVRAMGLDSLAQNLSTYTLDFTDASSITANYQPYVYLLYNYGILTGDEEKNFAPASTVDRAVSATFLSRILSYIEDSGLSPELPEYTDYTWIAGNIMAVTAGEKSNITLILSNTVTGETKLTVPASVKLYKNDREVETKDLKAGLYVRVCYDDSGNIFALRLSDASRLSADSGTVQTIDGQSVAILSNGELKTYGVNRFTEVYVGGQAGSSELIDPDGGYAQASVRYNESGTAVSLQLYGGTRLEEGFLTEVSSRTNGGYSLQFVGLDGAARRLTVEADSPIRINGISGTLKNSYVGGFVTLRVSNEDPTVCTQVEVDTLVSCLQGSIKSVISSRVPGSITVTDLETRKAVTCSVPEWAEVYLDGRRTTLSSLNIGCFVTIKCALDGEALLISAWPGTVETTGELTEIAYGSTTVLTVTREDGVNVQFSLDMTDLPTIKRDGKDSTIARLATGDQVTVTVRYQEITQIDAVSQSANAVGVIETITHSADSSELTVMLTDGTVETYTLGQNATLTQGDKLVSRTTLQPGYRLSMLVSGGAVLSAEVESSQASTNRITGTVLYVDTNAKEILFQLDSGLAITVNITTSTKYTDAATGSSISLRNLAPNDSLTIYGGYRGGEFDATLVIRE